MKADLIYIRHFQWSINLNARLKLILVLNVQIHLKLKQEGHKKGFRKAKWFWCKCKDSSETLTLKTQETASVQMWWFICLLGEKGVLVWFQSVTRIHFMLGQEGHAASHCQIKHRLPSVETPGDRGAAESPYKYCVYLIHCLWHTGAYYWNQAEPSCECWWHLSYFKLPVTGRRGSRAAVGAAARLVDNISETTTN